MNYKDTLLMPKTDFPMRGGLPNKEPNIQEKWESDQIYQKVLEKNKDLPKFILHDGPPYANGDIHLGHAENKILKDIIVRYKSMNGFNAPYIPGWDTHGLPIETALAKKKKVNRKEHSIAEFRKMCAEYALEQVKLQKEQFKRLGVRGDWDNPYITLNKVYEAEQIKVFGEMANRGLIYKGKKPVYWSPSSESAFAEAEIEYQDKRSPSIYVAFPVKDGKGVLEQDVSVVIWTTTPWTLPANLGISVHPVYTYVVVEADGRKFVVVEDLLEHLTTSLEWENTKVLKKMKGAELEHVVTTNPLYDRDSLVVLSDHVTTESGTGCVHTAPGHGEDDFKVGKRYNLGILCPVDGKGVMTDEAPGYEGMFYDTANKPITEKLKEVNALLKLEFITHSYPHDWRTKKPIIFRVTDQWFASIEKIKDQILSEIKDVKWYPSWGETRLHNMVKDRDDWCISRQRVWGVPIPVFYGEDGEPIITPETIDHISNLFREHGSNIWFEWEATELLPEGFTSEHSPNGTFTKETDIMDVWFDSGSSHQSVLNERPELDRPADVYLEGTDQYRGWFNSSLTTSVAVTGKAPYKTIITHGFTLDGEGKKMSKSLGNVIDPMKVMKQLGADIIRLWVSSVDYQSDVRVSDDILKQVSEVYRKIRNTLRFMLGNLNGFDPTQHRVAYEDMNELDQYMAVKVNKLVERVKDAYDDYQFLSVYNAVHNFCTIELSSFYLDLAKDTLYIEGENDHKRRSMQTVLYDSVVSLTQLVAPILAHTADEVWAYIPGVKEESVQLSNMPEVKQYDNAEALIEKWDGMLEIRDEVLKALENARNEKVIGKSLAASIELYPSTEAKELLNGVAELDKFFIVSKASIAGDKDHAPEEAHVYDQVGIVVKAADGETCDRCWTVTTTVGTDADHPTLCERCATVVKNNY
ncbi:isoleucine--tRNA ligase [Pseudalkalibacillus berkeleyi]|uniref:Isoleucine--tRNA ligase n=1 Tax=Pseudalkalibacillus berkeleyi TaxID=1069813 RepID=A0ABS9GZD5_9BACL|nr:isoleucine--tRNA ligase [Pseudalkalibacillus berkeleyi]MCF6137031.1 isoleucine--tRNA ligase [Pseudalkalibacillus berkeleyi]